MKTDPVCVYHLVSGILTRKVQMCTKAANEMLISEWLSTFKELVKEYMDVMLVTSTQNMVD